VPEAPRLPNPESRTSSLESDLCFQNPSSCHQVGHMKNEIGRDPGDARAFRRLPNGKYDLDQWNDDYWTRFQNMLRWTHERDIIVQIEVWDRFDHARDFWLTDPFNPVNNVNYTTQETGLEPRYPDHPSTDKQPFFHTIPGMPRYEPRLDVVRRYQERFVEKMLSYSLPYGNVLYCMNNETTTPLEWGQYWMRFIRDRARRLGVSAYVTDMFDDAWNPQRSAPLRAAIDHPELYLFLDVSQVNSRNFGQAHWDRFQWIVGQVSKSPRPLNHTKIYSAGETSFGSGTPKEGVGRFWRNIVGGAASARFHRPPAGIGLNEIAQACIRAARKVETRVKFWEVTPRMDLLTERQPNEAYLAAKPGDRHILFFTDGGSVQLDLRGHPQRFQLRWVNISTGEWGSEEEVQGGTRVPIVAPSPGPWAAAITRGA
ncbi:MAG: DUF6298 domain-containing protein, partial [Armatimonadota bacterium]|nr:DUF6298 domain-containing protein [Armatimonadota bacterium]